jgi:hypothetical protein
MKYPQLQEVNVDRGAGGTVTASTFDKRISTTVAAKILGVTIQTCAHYCKHGWLQYTRVGRGDNKHYQVYERDVLHLRTQIEMGIKLDRRYLQQSVNMVERRLGMRTVGYKTSVYGPRDKRIRNPGSRRTTEFPAVQEHSL